ncbi:RNA polymerase sigma 70 [Pandoraea thiooxydans]|uniref:RNA polymerase sigma factor RpoH n=1 Tax=Pandoraea thiooxydans TaxID=445709 RepID=A0A0G3ET73_9BURK|nr:RNA polymerase sigma factor RpoH [Pandoraea thiooxydans]AKJ69229.1 RNA polymerase factor sigma-32 [Pandoraea thiooxydans]APR96832.1 RNA polymerase sigma 70 [Pandoraea thiooxydans]
MSDAMTTQSHSPLAVKAQEARALTLSPSAMLPASVGNIDAYIQAVNRIPLLTADEERQLATEYRDHENLDAARRLVLSHLRLVVSVARNYLGYGLPHADLIQEGNIGLMKAVKRFDPAQGVRLVSYAIHWIKAEIHEYILRNWRMVKVATTKAQRKLFFNLRSHKQGVQAFTPEEIETVAKELNVKREEVAEMETRLSGGDIALEGKVEDGEEAFAPIAYLADTHNEPTAVLAARQHDRLQSDGLGSALDKLDARSRRIIEARWLNVRDDGSGGSTLHDLADEFGVSAERIRQIEVTAMKKMKTALQAYV